MKKTTIEVPIFEEGDVVYFTEALENGSSNYGIGIVNKNMIIPKDCTLYIYKNIKVEVRYRESIATSFSPLNLKIAEI